MTDLPSLERDVILLEAPEALPGWLASWVAASFNRCRVVSSGDAAVSACQQGRPAAVVLDARYAGASGEAVLATCRTLKANAFTGIVPVLLLTSPERLADGFAAGADEVVHPQLAEAEAIARLDALLRRSARDTDVHPSTRLPGARAIEGELRRRVARRAPFAACYADLDHFKEFNDRYGFHHGDRVIRLVAHILHDVVRGLCGDEGFVGHIGGDDFLFVVPLAAMPRVCDEVVRVFDELVPLQYSEQDRRMGYFFGKDRRGQLHRVPLMTVSIGVVTNQRRQFAGAAEVSELATEMKSFAKTQPGSLWAVDRRREEGPPRESSGPGGWSAGPADEARRRAGA
jgi:diguanylate cyclase (GGDEF)-like protein